VRFVAFAARQQTREALLILTIFSDRYKPMPEGDSNPAGKVIQVTFKPPFSLININHGGSPTP
jgi:hypothetical protein